MRGETFGAGLRFWRTKRELSLRGLANLAHYSKSQISDLERGVRAPRPDMADHLDRVLEAEGELRALSELLAPPSNEPPLLDARSYTALAVQLLAAEGDADMLDRRQFLGLGSATSLSAIAPGLALEATRHGLALSLAEERADTAADEWREIVWEYGYSYISLPPQELLQSLMVDMLGLQVAIERGSRSTPMNELRQYGATLASLMAMTIANVGDVRQARRWWRTARNLAEESGDPSTIMWIRGREVVRGLYEARPAAAILQMIEQAESFANGSTPTDRAELMSGKAQTFALAGRRAEAEAALHEVRSIYDSLPPETIDNRDSIYGWPEDRLRFTESYVFTYLGDAREATAAQDRAIKAYPTTYRRGPAQIELQRALWMVNTGDVAAGVEHASAALQSLPSRDQIRPIVALAKEVLGAVPTLQASKPAVVEFRECLELSAG
ncbi:helix-turn-helix transcriptional regulator [Kribbella sp. NPDC000426]|uniref:helix-turn-helix domain-containing protein n=1 Tax=Kribbella sp. NPDC000426 TaxID=3154255 RepID=UPI00332F6ABD